MAFWRSVPPHAADPWDDTLNLLFPEGLDAEQRARVATAVEGRSPSPSTLRLALGALDQQTTPSPVTIRWCADDIETVDVRGVAVSTDRADASVSVQIASGDYEPHVVATLDRLLGAGDTFVDVGANVGYHSVIASGLVGPTGRVVAIEANTENARLLARTVEVNELDNVTVLPVALSDRWGHVTFGSHVGSNGGFLGVDMIATGHGTIVPTVPLDDLAVGNVSLVKIDVEGAEALVIDGSMGLVESQRPVLVMEFSVEMTARVSRRDPAEHLARFVELGYEIAVIDRQTAEPASIESVDSLLANWGPLTRIEDLLLLPG